MNTRFLAVVPVLACVCVCGTAGAAQPITGAITADNHYALYSSVGGSFTYHGGNETDASGDPGQYNWSQAEAVQFSVGDVLYIAAWSDDAVAQGVLAQFQSAGLGTILSGDARWQVYAADVNLGDGDAHPTASFIAGHVAAADAGNLWQTPFVGDKNGVDPWGTIAGIDADSRWMWRNTPGDADPLHGGSGSGEVLIFKTAVPAPGAAGLLGLGGLVALRRRR